MTNITPRLSFAEAIEILTRLQEEGRIAMSIQEEIINRHHEISDGIYERGITDLRAQVDSLGRERDGLAGMVVAKDEALTELQDACMSGRTEDGYSELVIHHEPFLKAGNALALSLPAAVAQAQSWREKAELLDWLLKRGYAVYSECPENDEQFTVLRSWQYKYKYAMPEKWFDTPLEALRAAKEAENGK